MQLPQPTTVCVSCGHATKRSNRPIGTTNKRAIRGGHEPGAGYVADCDSRRNMCWREVKLLWCADILEVTWPGRWRRWTRWWIGMRMPWTSFVVVDAAISMMRAAICARAQRGFVVAAEHTAFCALAHPAWDPTDGVHQSVGNKRQEIVCSEAPKTHCCTSGQQSLYFWHFGKLHWQALPLIKVQDCSAAHVTLLPPCRIRCKVLRFVLSGTVAARTAAVKASQIIANARCVSNVVSS